MKRIILFAITTSLLTTGLTYAQEEAAPVFGIKFGGFVKTDIFYDTRQSSESLGLREGHFYLYPDNVSLDADGVDINANGSLHMLSIQTRLKGSITGPDAFGAKTSGIIEAEFFGTSSGDVNGFRLRHAFVNLDWGKSSLIVGQTWHPMFPAQSFPGTVSFNTGVPFVPFSRNPQVRFTYKAGDLSLLLTSYAQRDFTSTGPDGASNKYLRNSTIPTVDFQVQFVPGGSKHFIMAGVDYKTLRPELKTSKGYATDATIGSLSAYANVKIYTAPVTFKAMATYGQNATDLMMLGGYAISDTIDAATGYKEYTNLSVFSTWAEISTNGTKVQFGLFAGYCKNLGAPVALNGKTFARGADVDNLWRISPRLNFNSGKFTFGNEIEMTQAAYTSGGVVSEHVTNVRFLVSAIYNF